MDILRRPHVFGDRSPAFSDVFQACHDLCYRSSALERGKMDFLFDMLDIAPNQSPVIQLLPQQPL
jgi:hypothetical protein